MVSITRTALGSVLLISIVLPRTVSSSPVFETYSYDSIPAEEARVEEAEPSWSEAEAKNAKRHSEGTFTSDYSKYLDTVRAKDFVHWLIGTKRGRAPARRQAEGKRHAEGTIASDYSSVLDGKAAKDFVDWLVRNRGRGKRELLSDQDTMLDSAALEGAEEEGEQEEEEVVGPMPRVSPDSAELSFILEQLSTQQLMRLLQSSGGPCEPTSRGAFAD
uniref:Glucagon-like n=1 Tax=Petromyzon marinus TaxID=7757 RepID=A0AAJ7TAN7_PETMA|nr:glucagon-like [Petromyzon marinus]